MTRKPTTRQSKPTRKPVTIDLEAQDVDKAKSADTTVPKAEPVAFGRDPAATGKPETMAEKIETRAGTKSAGADAAAQGAVESGTAGAKEKASTPPPRSAAPPPPPPANHGFSALGGGIFGGLIALLIAGGLQWAGVIPSLQNAPPPDLSPLQSEIDSLSGKMAALESAGAGDVPQDVMARVDGAETEIAAVKQQVTALAQSVSSGAAGDGAGLETLAARTGAVETALADIGTKLSSLEGASPSAAMVDTLQADVQSAAAAAASASEGLHGLRGEVGKIGESVSGLAAKVGNLDERLTSAEADIDSGAGSRVAGAIAASALKSAADRGGSFMSELESYAAVAGSDETVESLRSYAASGVPTLPQLVERFPSVANAIVSTGNGLAPDAGIADRLMASARSLVQVRPVGEVEGDKPGAIAARMEVALQSGDIARALAEWETLPEPSKAVSSEFVDDLRARDKLDSLIADVLSGAMKPAQPAAGQ
jgi:hypothetical protein